MGQSDPPTPPTPGFKTAYWVRYLANAVIIILFLLSLVSDFVTTSQVTGAWLGLSEIQWHWATFIFGAATAIYNGLTHAPPLPAWPTKSTIATEAQIHEIRKAS